MPATPNAPSNNNSARARQQMTFPSSSGAGGSGSHHHHHHPSSPSTSTSFHYSSRIVVIGSENCTSAILGCQIQENQISLTGRLGEWAKASQAFGCGEIQMNERLVNCPTSKRSMRSNKNTATNNNNNNTSASSNAVSQQQSMANLRSEIPSTKNTNLDLRATDSAANITTNTNLESPNSNNNNSSKQNAVAQLIHAKATTLNHLLPGLTLELFEINETDVQTLTHDQLFGPYVLPSNTAGVVIVLDCAALFPAPPTCSLLVESVESVIQTVERKRKELAQKKARETMMYSPLLSIDEDLTATEQKRGGDQQQQQQQQKSNTKNSTKNNKKEEENPDKIPIPTLCDVLETYRQRQDGAAEQYILNSTERIQAIRLALDTWAGSGGASIPIHVALHNTEIVAPRLEAWSLTSQWAKISDAARAKVLSKLPKRDPEDMIASSGKPAFVLPSMISCCAPEPFVQPHLTLHKTHPQVSGTVRAIRGVLSTISNRTNGVLFFPSLTSVLDQTPIALLSSIIARPQVIPHNSHLQEIVHSFKTRCLFRRVFVVEPRSLLVLATDKPFSKLVGGIPRSANEKETMATLLGAHQNSSSIAKTPGAETSFSQAQSFIQDFLSVVDTIKLSTALAPITLEKFSEEETTLIKAAFEKEDHYDILTNVAEGGLASWRGSFEMTNGEGVYLYGLAPPVNLLLCCIGDCQETQRTQSLIEFNLHIIQQTVSGLFEETIKRARASGYAP